MGINWDGIGAPPTGAVCEVRAEHIREGDWTEVKVLALGLHEKDVAVLVAEHGSGVVGKMHCLLYTEFEHHFRPIKTKEQVAAEERREAIEEMVYGAVGCERGGNNTNAFLICGFLYDAGYRRSSHEH